MGDRSNTVRFGSSQFGFDYSPKNPPKKILFVCSPGDMLVPFSQNVVTADNVTKGNRNKKARQVQKDLTDLLEGRVRSVVVDFDAMVAAHQLGLFRKPLEGYKHQVTLESRLGLGVKNMLADATGAQRQETASQKLLKMGLAAAAQALQDEWKASADQVEAVSAQDEPAPTVARPPGKRHLCLVVRRDLRLPALVPGAGPISAAG